MQKDADWTLRLFDGIKTAGFLEILEIYVYPAQV